MASRRSRIKGIANIPQRRKAAVTQEKIQEEEISSKREDDGVHNHTLVSEISESTSAKNKEDSAENHVPLEKSQLVTEEVSLKAKHISMALKEEIDIPTKEIERTHEVSSTQEKESAVSIENAEEITPAKNDVEVRVHNLTLETYKEKSNIDTSLIEVNGNQGSKEELEINVNQGSKGELEIKPKTNPEDEVEEVEPNLTSQVLTAATSDQCEQKVAEKRIFKKNFIKPIISSSAFQRRNKVKVEENAESQHETAAAVAEPKKDITKSVHFLLDEKEEQANKEVEQHPIKETNNVYPPAPPSPSKINRVRIKVAPRLGQRRTSFSASESEDDNRKSNRHRNDSVCSTTSGVADQLECPHSPKKEFANVVQRKFRRTEQSRKLAEARREFLQKFGSSKPDRQKLTMVDLIFYNPSSNPMSQNRKRKTTEGDTKKNLDEVEEENEEKSQPEEMAESDEENDCLPAPQIKVGPDGEITIDEQSLVIENKQVKKSKEKIQRSKLVDGDNVTTYGVYKKAKKTKLWTKKETLRFYKALNAIGTDFSLMLSLFPGRTRRDLTMKFKKEEKINAALIDKALKVPNTYGITEIQREMELEEREEREKERVKQEVELLAKQKAEEKRKQREENKERKCAPSPPRKRSQSARKLYKDLSKGVNSFLDDDSDADDESDVSSQSIADVTLDMLQQANSAKAKSLRPRKIRRIYTDPEDSDDEGQGIVVTKKAEESAPVDVEESQNLKPGSVMIYSSEGPDGNQVYKVCMVAPPQGEDAHVQKSILNIGTLRIEENVTTPAEECNMTIPAGQEDAVLGVAQKKEPNCIIQQNIVIKPGVGDDKENVGSDCVENKNQI